jgi:Na+/proline symporter
MGLLLARKLWQGNFVTLGDLFRARYGPLVEKVAVLILIPSSLIWAAAQVRAFGQVISATTELPVDLAIAASAAFVVAYTLLGGLLGDVITDLIQGGLLAISLVVLFGVSVFHLGGAVAFAEAIDVERLSLVGPGETLLEQLDRWMVPILGSLVAQELVSRVLAARSVTVATRSSVLASFVYLGVGSIPILLGLVGPTLLPGLDDPERFLPTVARRLLPTALFVLFSGALISAILSTIDSILLSIGALVSHNVVVPLLGLTKEREKLRSARIVVFVSGALAFVLALHAEGVYDLVETASAFGTAGILVTTLVATYFRAGGPAAALAALGTGVVMTPVLEYVLEFSAPFLGSIAAATAVYAVVAIATPTSQATREPSAVRGD